MTTAWTGTAVYGGTPPVQPGTPEAQVAASQGAEVSPAVTQPTEPKGIWANPTFWAVSALGAAFVLVHLSVRDPL